MVMPEVPPVRREVSPVSGLSHVFDKTTCYCLVHHHFCLNEQINGPEVTMIKVSDVVFIKTGDARGKWAVVECVAADDYYVSVHGNLYWMLILKREDINKPKDDGLEEMRSIWDDKPKGVKMVDPILFAGSILDFRERYSYTDERGLCIIWAKQSSGAWRAYQQIPEIDLYAVRGDLNAKDDEQLWEQLHAVRRSKSTGGN